jgi:hypothetical protein
MPELARRERSGTVAEAAAARGAIDSREALRYLGLSEKDPRAHALLLVCDRYGLDPLLGHISIYKEKIYVHFAAYIHLANQHSAYQGMECVREWEDEKYCYAEVRVHRSDRAFPFQRRGKSLKVKPKKDGKGTYDDFEADAKAFAQAARRALRLAFNVEWPEPEPEYDPNADEPSAPGPVTEVVRRVDAAELQVGVEHRIARTVEELEPEIVADRETGEVYKPADEPPDEPGEMDEYGWPPEPDDEEAAPAGPAVTPLPAGPAAPSESLPDWVRQERAQRAAHGRRGVKMSGAASARPPAAAAAPGPTPAAGPLAAGGTPAGQTAAGPAGDREAPVGAAPTLLDGGEGP